MQLNAPLAKIRWLSTYGDLKTLVRAEGCLNKQPLYYTVTALALSGMLACGLAVLFVLPGLPLQLVDAVFLAFVFGQLGLLGHDAGHNQVFAAGRWNTILGRICGNLLLGMGLAWWQEHHNAHHASPNQEGRDPDADLGVLALSPEQATRRRGFSRWASRHQLFLAPVFASLQVFALHRYTIGFLATRRSRSRDVEAGLVAAHFVLYLGVLCLALGVPRGLLFAVVQCVVSGWYLNVIFGTNHTGMPILNNSQHMDFVQQQVTTSRNVRVPRGLSFLFGGLDLQIEHHLFPTMPRNQLRRAQPLVKAFCARHDLSYQESGFVQAYRDIFQHMWRISRLVPTSPMAS
ncbi:MAG TPA: acyl-CoA desaturase [Chloroflexota bacterium]|jgi:fatty acid desaturase|nr:acyl-CoA desaturase [Chloroflexota bacterium]